MAKSTDTPTKLDKCPSCSGDWKTVTKDGRTYDQCGDCGYVNSDSVKDTSDK